MIRSFEWFLALRYLTARRKGLGGWLTTIIAVGGVSLGVAALIVTLAVMTGFQEDIRGKILGAQPHLLAMAPQGAMSARDWTEPLKSISEVESWAPFVMGQSLIKRGPSAAGAVIKGVDPLREGSVTGLDKRVIDGRWEDLSQPVSNGPSPMFLGKELARTLRASPGDDLLVLGSSADADPMTGLPELHVFRVAGLIETGLYDYDSSLAVTSIAAAQPVFQLEDNHSGVGIRIKHPDKASKVAIAVQQKMGPVALVRSWLHMNQNLFAALKLEKTVMFIILTLITLVAAFTIVSNLLLITAQKVREIGILQALGAPRNCIRRIFLLQGLMMGGTGVCLGTVLGIAISALLKRYQFVQLPADVYYVDKLPVKIMPADVGLVGLAAFAIVLIATLYPAYQAAKLDALTAIRQT